MLKKLTASLFLTILISLSPLGAFAQNIDNALDAWEKASTQFVDKYKNLPTNQLEDTLMNENTLFAFQMIPEVERLNLAMADVFNNLLQNQGNRARLPEKEQQLLKKLESKGFQLSMGEGQYWLQPGNKIFYQAFLPYVSSDMKAYLTCLGSQPDAFFRDGGLKFPVRNYIGWAMQWDDFLLKHPNHRQTAKAQQQYRFLMMTALFSTLPNTPAFPRYNKGKMEKSWVEELQAAIKNQPETRTRAIVNHFLKALERSGNKISKSDRRQIEKQIQAVK